MAKPKADRYSPTALLKQALKRYVDGEAELGRYRMEVQAKRPEGFLGRLADLLDQGYYQAEEAKLARQLVDTWTVVLAQKGHQTVFAGREGAKYTNELRSKKKQAQIAKWIAYAKPLQPCPTHSAEAHRINARFPKDKFGTIRRNLPPRETW